MRTKFWWLVGSSLVLLCGGAPYWFGVQAEQTYHALLQQWEVSWDVRIQHSQYTRGWFSATAEAVVTLPAAAAALLATGQDAQHRAATLQLQILHGPWPFMALFRTRASLLPVQVLLEYTLALRPSPFPAVQGHTTVSLLGAVSSDLLLPAYTPQSPAHGRVRWAAVQGHVDVAADASRLIGRFTLPHVQYAQTEGSVVLRRSTARVQVSGASIQSLEVEVWLDLEGLETLSPQGPRLPWALQVGTVHAVTTLFGNLLHGTVEIQSRHILFGDLSYGPGTAQILLHRLHLPALSALLPYLLRAPSPPSSFDAVWWRVLTQTAPELLLSHLYIQTGHGEVRVQAGMRLESDTLPAATLRHTLRQAITAEAEAQAPVAFVQTALATAGRYLMRAQSPSVAWMPEKALQAIAATVTAQQLQGLVEQHYVLIEDETYKSVVRYMRGQLLVQEQPVMEWSGVP